MKQVKSILTIILIVTVIASVFTGCNEEKKTAVANYEAEFARIHTEYDALQQTISESQALIDAGEKPYDEKTISALETEISNAKASIVEIPKRKGNAAEINLLVENELKKITYVEVNKRLAAAKTELENSIKIMKQVTNPSEAFIIERIKDIEGITGYAGVTEDNDPNGNLNKPGGYTATVYFAYDKVKDPYHILDGTIVDNGTVGGGALEVYTCEEDAVKREEYLASFDGSVLASGSHTVVGTILVRTSDELSAGEQKELEAKIIQNLTELRA